MGAWTSSASLLHRAHISSRTPALARQTKSLISVNSAPSPPTTTTQTVTADQTATSTAATRPAAGWYVSGHETSLFPRNFRYVRSAKWESEKSIQQRVQKRREEEKERRLPLPAMRRRELPHFFWAM